jgi:hypothetical protein
MQVVVNNVHVVMSSSASAGAAKVMALSQFVPAFMQPKAKGASAQLTQVLSSPSA